ncbi:Coronin-7 [Blyttiomyces sp. JEL0837]|nr:Coronin-7 [Blyttiomyces sp. JEL0837]
MLRVNDPRVSTSTLSTQAHIGVKPTSVIWLGDSDLIFSAGFSKTRDREYAVWDIRSFTRPVSLTKIDNSPGIITPLFDPDTKLLFMVGKGDTSIRWLEVNMQTPAQILPTQPHLASLSLSTACMVPKTGLDVMSCEVVRLLALSSDGTAVIPVSGCVPRKTFVDFHADLFPDTAADEPAISGSDWLKGGNGIQKKISLDPRNARPKPGLVGVETKPAVLTHVNATTNPSVPIAEAKVSASLAEKLVQDTAKLQLAQTQKEVVNSVPNSPPASLKPSPSTKPKFAFAAQSTYRFLEGAPSTILEDLRGLQTSTPSECRGLDANNVIAAFPLVGPGGRIAVWRLEKKGRLPTKIPALICGSDLCDFQISPFQPYRIFSLSEDGNIRIWDVPKEGLVEDTTQANDSFKAHNGKATFLEAHPTVENLLLTAGFESISPVIKLWDLSDKTVLKTFSHPESIFAASFSVDGKFLATVSRDKRVRSFALADGSLLSSGIAHEGTKGARCAWVGTTDYVVTIGFGRANQREVHVFDSKNMERSLSSLQLDMSPSLQSLYYDNDLNLMYLFGKGESNAQILQLIIEGTKVSLKTVTKHSASLPQFGVKFASKVDCNIREVELHKCYRLQQTSLEVLSFKLPRHRKEFFQDDIFPPTLTFDPIDAASWKTGLRPVVKYQNLCPPGMLPLSMQERESNRVDQSKFIKSSNVVDTKEAIFRQMQETAANDSSVMPQDKQEGVDESEWDD